ncbi:MAG: class I SAM-dependent methyltransferase [Planctomycetaceae bacterium]
MDVIGADGLFSAARKGINSIGIAPSLTAVITARQIRRRLQLPCSFLVGDCRYLPSRDDTFRDVFSCSVVQHFSRTNTQRACVDFFRVLRPDGNCLLQMPNILAYAVSITLLAASSAMAMGF